MDTNRTPDEIDLLATQDIAAEELDDSAAAGLSTGSSISSGSTVGGTFSSIGSLSTVN
jgi:Na+/H+ antiporter NhaD/arsenite permease-like protein